MDINRYIEHTNLRPELNDSDVERLIQEAMSFQFVGVCLPPFWIKKARRELEEVDIQLVTVVGFPLGYDRTEAKIKTIEKAIDDGADELDLVMNISAFKSALPWTKIEMAKCAKLAHDNDKILKIIIETAYLERQEIIDACRIASDAGADFVKTSTGFAPAGARVEHIKLMRANCPSNVGIKASGGIRDLTTANAMIDAGADRLGLSAGVEIMQEFLSRD